MEDSTLATALSKAGESPVLAAACCMDCSTEAEPWAEAVTGEVAPGAGTEFSESASRAENGLPAVVAGTKSLKNRVSKAQYSNGSIRLDNLLVFSVQA
jgi:hypothetical protein